MPSALLYDPYSGISGDMHLGAMIDIGVPAEFLRAELAKLGMAKEYTLVVEPGVAKGISGTRATVRLGPDAARPERHLSTITKLIAAAGFSPAVEKFAVDVFHAIGVAEAKVHGTSIEKIHFHEVGATDSIVDIVAAALALDYLAVETIYCGTVELGGGMVRCAHGLLPVPAPATAEIVAGIPTHRGRVDSEATTPTGAAILKCAVAEFGTPARFVGEKVGYGLGQKEFDIPNALRVELGRADGTPSAECYDLESAFEIDCNIDDMPPEAFQPLMAALFDSGAQDVFLTPIQMKKSRPATRVSVLVAAAEQDAVMATLFQQSTTIGVRVHGVDKTMLRRRVHSIDTRCGTVRVKSVTLPDGTVRHKPEHDDVVAAAAREGIDYMSARRLIEADIETNFSS